MSKPRLFAARIARDKSGAAAVEFAIVSVAFLALIFGISYLGIMLYNSLSLNWAMEKGARIAALNKAATQSEIATAINSYLTSVKVPTATVTATNVTVDGVNGLSISATFTRTYAVPLISTFTITHSATTYVPLGS